MLSMQGDALLIWRRCINPYEATIISSRMQHRSLHSNINMRDITLITASLFFSMIPLHDNRTHQQHFLAKAVALYGEISAPSQAGVVSA